MKQSVSEKVPWKTGDYISLTGEMTNYLYVDGGLIVGIFYGHSSTDTFVLDTDGKLLRLERNRCGYKLFGLGRNGFEWSGLAVNISVHRSLT